MDDAAKAAAAMQAQMMADLGSMRRDIISAPTEEVRRGRNHDEREGASILAEDQARRDKIKKSQGKDALKLNAWNTEDNFEKDECVSHLENRFSGQGHRRELNNRSRQYDEEREARENRFGEERSLYVQQRGGHGNIHVKSSPAHRDRASGRNAVPRSLAEGPNLSSRGRQAPVPRSKAPRAPSPRAQGTVHFRNGVRVNDGHARAPPATANGESTAKAPNAPSAPATTHDPILASTCYQVALWHAANPGEKCEQYHKQHPDRMIYLRRARDQLIQEAIWLAVQGDEHKTRVYIETHKDRKWMVEAAVKAKDQVENDSEEEIEAYCASNSTHHDLIGAAKAVFTRKESKVKATAVQAPQVSAPKTEPSKVNASEVKAPEMKPPEMKTPEMKPPEMKPPEMKTPELTREPSVESNTASPDGEAPTSIAASTTILSAMGKLTAHFYDTAGDYLGHHQLSVNAPVAVILNITSRAASYDPRELIKAIETLASNMQNMSQSLEGVKLGDDGLWESDEEL